ncbi:hypothetical protein PAPYR_153 [Paratrimastix pyriformis]|uniref:Uncharacterized protein n=1 Tax=Paratrimastix pyriformis TaxID=342808 RepID=A0ABQ8UWV0_9EUKA|nr:hypothetical protein PAPYR_153 [Paratrimastix pyriformis]
MDAIIQQLNAFSNLVLQLHSQVIGFSTKFPPKEDPPPNFEIILGAFTAIRECILCENGPKLESQLIEGTRFLRHVLSLTSSAAWGALNLGWACVRMASEELRKHQTWGRPDDCCQDRNRLAIAIEGAGICKYIMQECQSFVGRLLTNQPTVSGVQGSSRHVIPLGRARSTRVEGNIATLHVSAAEDEDWRTVLRRETHDVAIAQFSAVREFLKEMENIRRDYTLVKDGAFQAE